MQTGENPANRIQPLASKAKAVVPKHSAFPYSSCTMQEYLIVQLQKIYIQALLASEAIVLKTRSLFTLFWFTEPLNIRKGHLGLVAWARPGWQRVFM
jgi:hypothetical protein